MFGTSFSSDAAQQGEDEADLPHTRRISGTVAFYGATQRSNASPLEGAKPRELQQIHMSMKQARDATGAQKIVVHFLYSSSGFGRI